MRTVLQSSCLRETEAQPDAAHGGRGAAPGGR
jgi:hypothetical protein